MGTGFFESDHTATQVVVVGGLRGGRGQGTHGTVQCEHAVLHDMMEASLSTGIPVFEEPAEDHEGDISVDPFHFNQL